MTKTSQPRRRSKQTKPLSAMGMQIAGLGLIFLILPKLFGGSLLMRVLSSGLSIPGWMLLVGGLVILGAEHYKKKTSLNSIGTPRVEPEPMSDHEKGVLVDAIFKHSPRQPAAPTPAPSQPAPDIRFGRAPSPTPDIRCGRKPERAANSPPPIANQWGPGIFAAIEWRRFEAVCETLFAQAGFRTQSQSHGADGGVDIWLHSTNAQGPVAVVQCKHWNGKPVGVKEMREFFGVMASHQLKRGTYATTSTYTADAQKFAKENGINALDGAALLSMIAKRTPEQQQALLAVAHEGEYWRPTCASCGIKLVERTAAKGGTAFWGCGNFPRCRTRMPMTAAS